MALAKQGYSGRVMKRIMITVSDEMFEDLSQRAHLHGVSVAEMLHQDAGIGKTLDGAAAGRSIFLGSGRKRLQLLHAIWYGGKHPA